VNVDVVDENSCEVEGLLMLDNVSCVLVDELVSELDVMDVSVL
jgi:hypothetical protein